MNTIALIAFLVGLLVGFLAGYAICREYHHE
jgi:uncharacterized protein YneF (UPF0154 family)